ncbi:MAG: hypothetical protein ABL958_00410, partial [Bdellovibrionia bacterium]
MRARSHVFANLVILFLGMVLGAPSFAQTAPQTITYQGRLMDPSGNTPLTGTVSLRLTILDPGETCTLYEEVQSVDLGTTGLFAVSVGSNMADPKRTGNDPGLAMSDVFSNSGSSTAIVLNGPNCPIVGGYIPATGDKRMMKVAVDGTDLTPNLALGSVPQALSAETLQGRSASGFVQITGNITQLNMATLTAGAASDASTLHNHDVHNDARFVRLNSVGNQNLGTGNIYTSGAVGIGTTTPAADLEIKRANPALRLTSQAGGQANIEFYSDTGSTVRSAIRGSDTNNTLTFLTGGTQALQLDAAQNAAFAGSLITVGTIGFGKYTTAQEGDFVTNGTLLFYLNVQGPAAKGTTWVNSTTNELRYWDGSSAQSVASVSALTASLAGKSDLTHNHDAAYAPIIHNHDAAYVNVAGDTMTGTLNLPASTAAAGSAPMKFAQGALMTAAENGAIEYDGTNLYFTDSGGVRRQLGIAGAGGVTTFNGRSGAVVPVANDYSWADINKTTSSLGDLSDRSATHLTGTLNDARLSSNVPLKNASNVFSTGGQSIVNSSATQVPLTLQGFAGQAANLFEVKDSGSTTLYSLQNLGVPTATTDLTTRDWVATALAGKADTTHNHDADYVNVGGDTMTGALNLPSNGLVAGTTQLVLSGGNVGIGTSTPGYKLEVSGDMRVSSNAYFSGTQIIHTSVPTQPSSFSTYSSGDTATLGAQVSYYRSRGTGTTVVSNDDQLGATTYFGDTGFMSHGGAAKIEASADGNFGLSDWPGRLTFWTTPDGTNSLTERMRITNSGSVGIGTTSPQAKLHVATGTDFKFNDKFNIEYAGANNTLISLIMGGNEIVGLGGTGMNGRMSLADNTVTTKVLLTASGDSYLTGGNVGIGTTDPGGGNAAFQGLHVVTNGTAMSVDTEISAMFQRSNAITDNNSIAVHSGRDGQASLYLGAYGVITDGGINYRYTAGNGPNGLAVRSGGATRIFASATTGNVGIGTTSPTAKLHLPASTAAAGSASLKIDQGTLLGTPESGAIEFDGTNLFYTDNSNTRRTIAAGGGDNLGNHTATQALQMGGFTINGSSSASGTLTLDSTSDATKGNVLINPTGGNVGIGTASPGSKLSVVGDSTITSNSVSAFAVGQNGATNPAFSVDASTASSGTGLRIKSMGASSGLFIYTDSPNANDNLLIYSKGVGSVYVGPPGGGGALFGTSASTMGGPNTSLVSDNANDIIKLNTGASERLRIDSSGNVGIGNTTPGTLLNVGAGTPTTAASGIQFGSDVATNLYRQAAGSLKTDGGLSAVYMTVNTGNSFGSGAGIGYIPNSGGGGSYMRHTGKVEINIDSDNSATDQYFAINKDADTNGGTELFRVQEDGSVGIGTTAPSGKLDVEGGSAYLPAPNAMPPSANIANSQYTVWLDETNDEFEFKGKRADGTVVSRTLGAAGAGNYVDEAGDTMTGTLNLPANGLVAGTDQLVLSGGYVGIGIATPLTVGHIRGPANQDLFTVDTAFSRAFTVYTSNPSGHGAVALRNSGGVVNVDLRANGNSFFNGGNVGIGTNAPTAGLHLRAGLAPAGNAPLKLTAGANLTVEEAGAIEFDGTNLFYTNSVPTRMTIATTSSRGKYLPLSGGTLTGALILPAGTEALPSLAVGTTGTG